MDNVSVWSLELTLAKMRSDQRNGRLQLAIPEYRDSWKNIRVTLPIWAQCFIWCLKTLTDVSDESLKKE